ncbi:MULTISPECIES: caspase family protein [Bacteroides]|jgi:hypothetical protein|uniref:caspase family protein n=1 Tax=Bacteroides TaxID=816 RepID=UPI0025A54096|nr:MULTISPECIES: caspase family protein [Bacteroides]
MRIAFLYLVVILSVFGLQAENRALLVGIGRYPVYTGWSEIHGDADVDLLAPALKKNGYSDVKTLKNAQATKAAIVKELKALANRCKAGDKVYFHFSGHGQPVTDINGDEGSKGYDEAIVPYDACKTKTSRVKCQWYNGENHLIDDELNPLFAKIKGKLGANGELFIAIDACYSDDMERAPGSEEADLPPTRGTNEKLNVNKTRAWTLMPKPKSFSPGAKMYVVSACKSNERNFEYKAKNGKTYGSLTYFIFSMMVKTMDFNQWTNRITTKTPSTPAIFQTFQHPQKQIYK